MFVPRKQRKQNEKKKNKKNKGIEHGFFGLHTDLC